MSEEMARIKSLLLEAMRIIEEQNPLPKESEVVDLSAALHSPKGGIWTVSVAKSNPKPIKFYDNGHIDNPQASSLWSVTGNELTMKWPSGAPGGFWVDKLKSTDDGRRFEGSNQNGVSIKVFFRPTVQPDDASSYSDKMEFNELKSLLGSDSWPQATFSFQVTDENSESDKRERAEGIANIILPSMKGKKFLDFGCGEGHLVDFVSGESVVSVGYDPHPSGSLAWDSDRDGFLLTSDLKKVASNGPYDVILLYDVLDHVEADMSSVLKTAGSLLADDGVMIVRFHPWCSRHGGHLYRKINKAFVHLILTDEELVALDIEPQKIQKVVMPLAVYTDAIQSSGLKIKKGPEIDGQDVESFFWTNHLVKSRIFRTFGLDMSKDESPKSLMSPCFFDYWLKK